MTKQISVYKGSGFSKDGVLVDFGIWKLILCTNKDIGNRYYNHYKSFELCLGVGFHKSILAFKQDQVNRFERYDRHCLSTVFN